MALDPNARAWQDLARQIRPNLPGDWAIGRSGIRSILVRLPVDWVITYIIADRSRRTRDPRIWVAQMPLALRWVGGLSLGHGVTSDRPTGPGGIDLSSPEAAETVWRFIEEVGLPKATWSDQDFAAEAERQFEQPDSERGRPLVHPEAAAWRVILDQGSPLPPALEAADWFDNAFAPEDAIWLRALVEHWSSGGRSAALSFLGQNREAAIEGLRLRPRPRP